MGRSARQSAHGGTPRPVDPALLYGRALEQVARGETSGRCRAVDHEGRVMTLPLARWVAPPDAEELALLEQLPSPVLDIGCGPGRHVGALVERGVPALGVDFATAAVGLARRRGAPIFEGSIFYPVPLTGRWGSALLLDGNVGIGGDPAALLRRAHQLLRPGGVLLVEADPDALGVERTTLRLEAEGEVSAWFPWTRVGVSGLVGLANRTGFGCEEVAGDGSRRFVRLTSSAASSGRFVRSAPAGDPALADA